MIKLYTLNLNLQKPLSCQLVAVSMISLLTTCQYASSFEDTPTIFKKKSAVKFSERSASTVSLEEVMEIPVVPKPSFTSTSTTLHITVEDVLSSETKGLYTPSRRSILSDTTSELSWDDIPTVRILSLDGGGARGITEARFIQKLTEQTGRTVPEMFHLVAGTSAGGILAGAYTLPAGQDDPKRSPPLYSSDYIFNVMMQRTKTLFEKSWSLWGLLGPRYKSASIDKFMNDFFGDITFDKTTTDTLVTTFDISANWPKIFKSWDTREIFYTRDVLKSTSAAPSYFAPRHIFPVNASTSHLGYTLSDGGTFANNPVTCALADARRLYPTITHFEIVSLGTGNSARPLHYSTMRNAGLIGWGRRLIDIFLNGQSTHTDYVMETLLPNEYSRWNPVLAEKNAALDNVSDNNLRDLVQTEDDLIASRRRQFDSLAETLRRPKSDLIPVQIYTERKA